MTFNISDKTKFYWGVNICWIGWTQDAYSHDMSYDFLHQWGPNPPDSKKFRDIIDAYFAHIKKKELDVVRMWLFEGLEGLQLSAYKAFNPPYEALKNRAPINHSRSDEFSYINWPAFEDRIKVIMDSAHRTGVQIYWSLFDSTVLLRDEDPYEYILYHESYHHLFKNMKNRKTFYKDIINPFLECITQYQDNIFAIDLINEVDWLWVKGGFNQDDIRSFVEELYWHIHDYFNDKKRVPVTVSFASYNEFKKSQKDFIFVDFFDYHRYLEPKNIDPSDDHGPLDIWHYPNGKLCIIGEAGDYYAVSSSKVVHEKEQASESGALMNQANNNGYSGILLWRYSLEGDRHRLLIHSYNNPKMVPSQLQESLERIKDPRNYHEFERPVWDEIKKCVGRPRPDIP